MVRTIWSATCLYSQDRGHQGLGCRAKFLVRAVFQWPSSIRWFRFLEKQPPLAAVLHKQSQWLHKLQRPYLCTGHSTEDKLHLLQQHFELFFQLLPRELYTRLLKESSILLATIEGKSGESYRVELGLAQIMDKEGELTLTLIPETSRNCLATMAFALGRNDHGHPIIYIGCLQGPKGEEGHRQFKAVTKDLYGLMPKILMFKTLCILARKMGIDSVLGVSSQSHVHNSISHHYQKIRFNYDDFWSSLGGQQTGSQYYLLGTRLKERSLLDISSNKRAQYQRRKALETCLENQCSAILAGDQLAVKLIRKSQ